MILIIQTLETTQPRIWSFPNCQHFLAQICSIFHWQLHSVFRRRKSVYVPVQTHRNGVLKKPDTIKSLFQLERLERNTPFHFWLEICLQKSELVNQTELCSLLLLPPPPFPHTFLPSSTSLFHPLEPEMAPIHTYLVSCKWHKCKVRGLWHMLAVQPTN